MSKMETVCSICNEVRQQSTQKPSFQILLSKLRREFRKNNLEILIRSCRNSSLTSEEYYVNAYYDAEDDYDNEIPIEIVIYHNFEKHVLWEYQNISDLLVQIFDAVVHEFRHQTQSQKRGHKIYWPHSNIVLQYLSDPDEIDAYSLSIAIELCRSLGKDRTLKHLSKFKRLSKFKIQNCLVSPNLFAFVKVFEDVDEDILKQLLKKVYKKIQKIDIDNIFV